MILNINSFKGDSGGPLICTSTDGSDFLAGISSWGLFCGHSDYPGVFSHIKHFKEWIDGEMNRGSVRSDSKKVDFKVNFQFVLNLMLLYKF